MIRRNLAEEKGFERPVRPPEWCSKNPEAGSDTSKTFYFIPLFIGLQTMKGGFTRQSTPGFKILVIPSGTNVVTTTVVLDAKVEDRQYTSASSFGFPRFIPRFASVRVLIPLR